MDCAKMRYYTAHNSDMLLKPHEYAKVFYASWAIDWIHYLYAIRIFVEMAFRYQKVNAEIGRTQSTKCQTIPK